MYWWFMLCLLLLFVGQQLQLQLLLLLLQHCTTATTATATAAITTTTTTTTTTATVFLCVQVSSALYAGGAMLSLVLLFIGYLPDLLLLTYVLTFTFPNYQTARFVMPTLYLIVSSNCFAVRICWDFCSHFYSVLTSGWACGV